MQIAILWMIVRRIWWRIMRNKLRERIFVVWACAVWKKSTNIVRSKAATSSQKEKTSSSSTRCSSHFLHRFFTGVNCHDCVFRDHQQFAERVNSCFSEPCENKGCSAYSPDFSHNHCVLVSKTSTRERGLRCNRFWWIKKWIKINLNRPFIDSSRFVSKAKFRCRTLLDVIVIFFGLLSG